ncbi:hypothetical protein P7K49_009262 [Saguinus oedipus]|uniref:Uncharacterized protein n=1 Tax=Saguinus oedipus TaxID=9490 RepID=A0ABQ9VJH5_SAGOE|nr:hypothetical protein P7K49_009262 [Saguinus oedipus]
MEVMWTHGWMASADGEQKEAWRSCGPTDGRPQWMENRAEHGGHVDPRMEGLSRWKTEQSMEVMWTHGWKASADGEQKEAWRSCGPMDGRPQWMENRAEHGGHVDPWMEGLSGWKTEQSMEVMWTLGWKASVDGEQSRAWRSCGPLDGRPQWMENRAEHGGHVDPWMEGLSGWKTEQSMEVMWTHGWKVSVNGKQSRAWRSCGPTDGWPQRMENRKKHGGHVDPWMEGLSGWRTEQSMEVMWTLGWKASVDGKQSRAWRSCGPLDGRPQWMENRAEHGGHVDPRMEGLSGWKTEQSMEVMWTHGWKVSVNGKQSRAWRSCGPTDGRPQRMENRKKHGGHVDPWMEGLSGWRTEQSMEVMWTHGWMVSVDGKQSRAWRSCGPTDGRSQ